MRLILWAFGVAVALDLLVGIGKKYQAHFSRLDARSAALEDASHGAALIVLAVLACLRFGFVLPAWFPLAAFAAVIWGGLRLYNGAKFSVGWRDPKLIVGASIKIGIGLAVSLLVWNPPPLMPVEALSAIAAFLYMTAPYGDWAAAAVVIWCVVTGLTKLVLLSRGLPVMPLPAPPHDARRSEVLET
jgi:hypothetical protein